MNKLRLLLSAGAMLSLVAGTANAARLIGMTGNDATPTGTGLVALPDGFGEMGSPYSGGQGLEGETAVPFSVPAPGTVNMRINSFVNEFPMAAWWTGMNGTGTPGANAGNKQQAYGIYGWIRIDLGVDGMTKNGVQYGAFTEIRENNTTNLGGVVSGGGVTSGASVNSSFAQNASADAGDNTLYVRHANAYIGTSQLGFLRMGTGLGAQVLYEVGLFDDFDIGGWISFASSNIPSNLAPVWPWADDGQYYMAGRIMYVSPVIDGFDGGISFAPNNSGPFDGSGCSAAYGGVGCATQSSSTLAGDYSTRYRNELGVALRYRNTFGPIGMAISGTYTTSGKVDSVVPSGAQLYKGLNVADIGATLQWNKQVEVGGNVMWGDVNGAWALKPVGGANGVAWVAGVKYEIPQLPATLGAYYFNYKYQGTTTAPFITQRTSQGLDVGAVYGMGPGVVLIAEYAWGQNYQGDFDFLTNTTGLANNKVTANVATLGMSVRF